MVGVVVSPTVGWTVGTTVGTTVGSADGSSEGPAVGLTVGLTVGPAVGAKVGPAVGSAVGQVLGMTVGIADGTTVGQTLGQALGASVGCAVDGRNVGTVLGLLVGLMTGASEGAAVVGTAVGRAVGLAERAVYEGSVEYKTLKTKQERYEVERTLTCEHDVTDRAFGGFITRTRDVQLIYRGAFSIIADNQRSSVTTLSGGVANIPRHDIDGEGSLQDETIEYYGWTLLNMVRSLVIQGCIP